MNKGDVYFADLDSTLGSEQTGSRPVIIVQSDLINRYTRTIVAIPLTTNLNRAGIPGCIVIRQGDGGLSQDSIALCYQIRVLDKSRLKTRLGKISPATIKNLEDALKITFDIT